MKKFITAIIFFTTLFFLTISANADVIYDNLSATSGGNASIALGPLGDSFSTGASGFTLGEVKLLLGAPVPGDGGSFSVVLVNNSSYTIGTVSDSQLSSSQLTVIDMTLTSPQTLAANKQYWIELFPNHNPDTSAIWSWSGDTSGTGVSGEYIFINGAFPTTERGAFQMQLSSPSAVPIPAAVWLLGSGLIGLVGVRRKLKK